MKPIEVNFAAYQITFYEGDRQESIVMFPKDEDNKKHGIYINDGFPVKWSEIHVSLPLETENVNNFNIQESKSLQRLYNTYSADPIETQTRPAIEVSSSKEHEYSGLRKGLGFNQAQSYCTDRDFKVTSLSRTGKCFDLNPFHSFNNRKLVRCYGKDVYSVGDTLKERILRDSKGNITSLGKITSQQNCKELSSHPGEVVFGFLESFK